MVLSLIGGLAAILGFIGCFVPVLPGPAIAYAALWVLLGFVLCVGLKVASVGLYAWWYFAAISN